MTVTQLYLYPIKSLAGIPVAEARLTDRGLEHDRRYMLVTAADNRFVTIRKFPAMTRFQPRLTGQGIHVSFGGAGPQGKGIMIPNGLPGGDSLRVTVWEQEVEALAVSADIDRWFSDRLGLECRLVYMPEASHRPAKPRMGERTAGKLTSFADAYPYLLIGEASLTDLNERYPGEDYIGMERFRPNIVIDGTAPYAEDELEYFSIGEHRFRGVENCARCQVPNVDPATGTVSERAEPMRTLATYRRWDRKVWFGRNLVGVDNAGGTVRVGDRLRPRS